MTSRSEASFPKLVCCTKIDAVESKSIADNAFFDVKFWPYELADAEHIFAVAGTTQVFVCRTVVGGSPPFEILCWWHNEQDSASANSVAWVKDPHSGKALLCITGAAPRHIAIIDVKTGDTVRELVGHGNSVNELLVSPVAPHILASCSEDFTIRLWNLNPEYVKNPCVAIIAGQGHKQPLLGMAFHPNGRWLLSGAHDTAVALWAVPGEETLAKRNVDDEPLQVHWPHFFSQEIHHNYVDSLAFYGDYIISRSACQQNNPAQKQHDILLWKIEGFDADAPAPDNFDIPQPGKQTRSSFPHSKGSQGFQRLLTFSMPHTDRFYLRFGLFYQAGSAPMLCMGNVQSKFSFWNLEKLEDQTVTEAPVNPSADGNRAGLPVLKKGVARKRKPGEPPLRTLVQIAQTEPTPQSSPLGRFDRDDSITSTDTGVGRTTRNVLEDPFPRIKPHHIVRCHTDVTKSHFASYTAAWSPDGHWVVAVGDSGTMVMMYRDKVG